MLGLGEIKVKIPTPGVNMVKDKIPASMRLIILDPIGITGFITYHRPQRIRGIEGQGND
jgi:hypothetical protein